MARLELEFSDKRLGAALLALDHLFRSMRSMRRALQILAAVEVQRLTPEARRDYITQRDDAVEFVRKLAAALKGDDDDED